MKLIKNIFLIFLIALVLYVVGLFALPEQTKNFGENIGLKDFNEVIFKLKGRADDISSINPNDALKNIQSGAVEILDKGTNYAKDVKTKIDGIRSTAQGVENTYNEVKTQIDETTKNIVEIGEKINEAKKSIDSVTNIIN